MERVETVIVGGGQAGLAMSYYLKQLEREHLVLEQAGQGASVWRNERWDSFTLVTPNWALRMPGAEYDGAEREAFMSRDDVVTYFDRYIERFRLPVQCNTRVESVEPLDHTGYRVQTRDHIYWADNVVMATGSEQQPKIPPFAADLSPAIMQLHSSRYRNPESLPDGAVLVVGSAQSGCQITEELSHRGRKVFLCTGSSSGRAPRRYRGKDTFEWLYQIGFFDLTPDRLPFPRGSFSAPHLSGTRGGHTINVHQFARDGVTLLGHLRGASSNKIWLAPDLHQNLARIDGFELKVRQMIDGYIQNAGFDAPAEETPQLRDGYEQPVIEELDLRAADISTVIWASGYSNDFRLIRMPILDNDGIPVQSRGVTDFPGLYFVGFPWMPSLKSGTLAGVGESAAHVASCIAGVDVRRDPVIDVRSTELGVGAIPAA